MSCCVLSSCCTVLTITSSGKGQSTNQKDLYIKVWNFVAGGSTVMPNGNGERNGYRNTYVVGTGVKGALVGGKTGIGSINVTVCVWVCVLVCVRACVRVCYPQLGDPHISNKPGRIKCNK